MYKRQANVSAEIKGVIIFLKSRISKNEIVIYTDKSKKIKTGLININKNIIKP